MKKSVKKAETTVNIAPQSPVQNANSTSQGYAIPDAEMLRRKYGIQSMEETNKESRAEEKNYGDDRVTELASTVEVLRSKLDEKNRKIEHLCTLLESLEPVSGIDAERIQQAMLAPQQTSGDAFDLRDSKIVSLAKKSHNLTMQLNKERGTNERLRKDLEEANRRLSNMEAELELQKSRAKSESTSSKVYNRTALEERGKMEEEEEKNASIARNLKEAQRSVEELKRRVKLLSDEKKELTRKLAKEIGDGTEGAEGLEKEGWKGRAQLIVVLRSRIKALESQLGNGSTASTLGQRVDVDARAEENLVEMTKERRQAVEALTEERLQLIDQVQSLEKKGNAFKARIQVLETEVRRLKDNLAVALDKSQTDDQLIEALRAEMHRLQGVEARGKDVERTLSSQLQSQKASIEGGVDNQREQQLQAEIRRLQRLVKNQAEQLDAQDVTIRELRKSSTTKG